MKIAFAAICKPTDEEAKFLDKCLASVKDYVDALYITQAGPEKNEAVSKVIEKYGGVESLYLWTNNFAAARNYNFSQVPKDFDYIFWLDADDTLTVSGGLLAVNGNMVHNAASIFNQSGGDILVDGNEGGVAANSVADVAVIANGHTVTSSTSGNFAKGVTIDGTLWSCGYNLYGALGLNDIIHRSSPVQVGSLMDWNKIACGVDFSAAIKPLTYTTLASFLSAKIETIELTPQSLHTTL